MSKSHSIYLVPYNLFHTVYFSPCCHLITWFVYIILIKIALTVTLSNFIAPSLISWLIYNWSSCFCLHFIHENWLLHIQYCFLFFLWQQISSACNFSFLWKSVHWMFRGMFCKEMKRFDTKCWFKLVCNYTNIIITYLCFDAFLDFIIKRDWLVKWQQKNVSYRHIRKVQPFVQSIAYWNTLHTQCIDID